MQVAIVGAGAAGLTAAHRLRQRGHTVTVFEAAETAGGRTRTLSIGPGHWIDAGAGWLASFYPSTLALFDELGERGALREMPMRGGGDLRYEGRTRPMPNSIGRLVSTDLLTPSDKVRFFAWMAGLLVRQPDDLRVDIRYDSTPAVAALGAIGSRPRERVVRATFEGPFFARLEEMSGALVRAWLRALSLGTFYQVEGGMDAPWRRLADSLDVRTGQSVVRVSRRGTGVAVTVAGADEVFDAAVVAVPAPIAGLLVDGDDAAALARGITYAPHVRVYAARRGNGRPRNSIHVLPNDLVATVERSSGRHGSWGRAPDDWEWGLVCAPAATSLPLLDLPEEIVVDRLWREARTIDPDLFDLRDAEVVRLVRWRHAVPIVGPGYYRRLAGLRQRAPIVFAGDWLVQPCVEGAVRSGNAAAAILQASRA